MYKAHKYLLKNPYVSVVTMYPKNLNKDETYFIECANRSIFYSYGSNLQLVYEKSKIIVSNTYPIIAVEPGGESLKTFKHPLNAMYIIGDNINDNFKVDFILSEDTFSSLFADQVASIVMYDRYIKNIN